MSSLIRWNPAREAFAMSEAMNRLFDNAFIMPGNSFRSGVPVIDLVDNGDNYVVKAELPGFKPDQVDIRVTGDTLTLSGQVETDNGKQENGQYQIHERFQSSFSRSVTLPTAVSADRATAEFENGVLTLVLPKDEAALPKKIAITNKSARK